MSFIRGIENESLDELKNEEQKIDITWNQNRRVNNGDREENNKIENKQEVGRYDDMYARSQNSAYLPPIFCF